MSGSSGKFVAFASILVNTAFAYIGIELVGVTAGEARDPSRDIPKAVRLTFWRIALFYCLSVFLLGLLVPYNSKELAFANKASTGASASPFVVAIKLASIPVLPTILIAIILLFVLSTANSDIYIVSRTLYGLAKTGQAPKMLGYSDSRGVPIFGLAAGGLGACIRFLE